MAFYYFNAEMKYREIPTVPPFDTATDAEIAETLERYYNGVFSLQDIQEVWSVGDKRSIPISAMTEGDNIPDVHHADNYEYVIIDFNHDDLVTPINNISKALITVQQDRMFFTDTTTTQCSGEDYDWAHEFGYMNSPAMAGWNNCARRAWCNNTYFNALPQYIKNNIKQVYKSTADNQSSSPIWVANKDKCFLLSEREVLGSNPYSAEAGTNSTHYVDYDGTAGTTITMPTGGIQYSYFNDTSNRIKYPIYTGYTTGMWWERSAYVNNSYLGFTNINRTNSADYWQSAGYLGIAPAFCL